MRGVGVRRRRGRGEREDHGSCLVAAAVMGWWLRLGRGGGCWAGSEDLLPTVLAHDRGSAPSLLFSLSLSLSLVHLE
jgi:hypothetical protein